ncbi:hypothetical protein [Kribbella sp. NPDC006257]|uniref:hypothetical protein n=1 Tax=Kribbella sp. NPDC006257 TaxID=3156738 RepID=UPI00339F726E
MKRQSGLLVAFVAAVTVAAVVLGGTIASRHVPHSENVAAAAPLTAPIKVPLAVNELGTGQLPEVPYVVGWNFKVLAYAAGKVYYQSSDVLGSGARWSTYAWTPGDPKALDRRSGRLLREWMGCFRSAAPEDEDHLLMVASAGRGKSAIVRCTVSTGDCELATPVAADNLLLS